MSALNILDKESLEKEISELYLEGQRILDPQLQGYFEKAIGLALMAKTDFESPNPNSVSNSLIITNLYKARGILTYAKATDQYKYDQNQDSVVFFVILLAISSILVFFYSWFTLDPYPPQLIYQIIFACFFAGVGGSIFNLLQSWTKGLSQNFSNWTNCLFFLLKGGIAGVILYLVLKSGLILVSGSTEVAHVEFLLVFAFIAGYFERFTERLLTNIRDKSIFYTQPQSQPQPQSNPQSPSQ